jgi:Chaperone for wingless signalling and trafficking of LDL receptor.
MFQEDEEPLEPDELPEHLRPAPPIDISKVHK